MLLKKELLFKLIEDGKITSCSIIGEPTKELQETYFSNNDLMDLFEKYNIKNPIEEFKSTPTAIYFPVKNHRFQCTEICSITISKKSLTIDNIKKIISTLLVDVFEYYQFDITPFHLDKIISGEKLNFEDMILFMRNSQAEIARSIGKSRQLITDMKSGKAKIGIDTLALLSKEYPLLPWREFILSFTDK
ncbi:helix-turn-helix transcriptional regulator [Clostridium botulinum]|uniref:helix-turn-helix domain-containing protein n=1 Tax=Clostridium botulinum TaxID=1491 RepID=UPI001C9B2C1C|nr:helix-turn-helix transcriptional regulator [Clostridium botulinum]MBY6889345.1 helix-turn-helix transcriptional regulator [Clostridium botulinum]